MQRGEVGCSAGEMVETLALTPAISPGERVNHLPLLESWEAMDCRIPRTEHMDGSWIQCGNSSLEKIFPAEKSLIYADHAIGGSIDQ
jgi:hypothetical protein